MAYRITVKRELRGIDKKWVARDDDGHWRAICGEHYGKTAGKAIYAMFHKNEIANVDDRGDVATADILQGGE